MIRLRRCLAAALASALLAPVGAARAATELWSAGDASIAISGSLRQILATSEQTDSEKFGAAFRQAVIDDLPADTCLRAATFEDCTAWRELGDLRAVQSLTRGRLRLDMRATRWLSAVVVYDMEVLAGHVDTLETALTADFATPTLFGAEGTILTGEHVVWAQSLYRGYAKLELGALESIVGRQRVAWGVGRLWTPIDRFNAIPPLALEPDQSAGVDSLLARWNFTGFNFAEVVWAPARQSRDMRVAGRLHGVVLDADLSLMGGWFEEAGTVGMDFARNVGGGALRLEAVWTRPTHPVWRIGESAPAPVPDYWQFVASVDNNFDLGTGLYVLIEYLYNGNALGVSSGELGPLVGVLEASETFPPGFLPPGSEPPPDALNPYLEAGFEDLLGTSQVFTAVEHQIGVDFGYDLTPEVRLDFLTLVDCSEGSAAFFPSLKYSPAGAFEITLGVQGFVGSRQSQYGGNGTLAYFLGEWFF